MSINEVICAVDQRFKKDEYVLIRVEEWQTLKTAVLAQQTNNTQSKQCQCTNSCVSTIYVCKDCGGRVNSKRQALLTFAKRCGKAGFKIGGAA